MKLSIIIPAYNAQPYIYELLECLKPQLNKDIEVIVVDDGSKDKIETDIKHVKVIRKENGGVSSARNVGIEASKGEYVSFIDADDLVAGDYVSQICAKMPFDVLEMSWKSIEGAGPQWSAKLNSDKDRLRNPSACTRAFSRQFIGDVRFNENKDSAEDEEFTRKLDMNRGRIAIVTDYLYFYRTYVENSGSKRSMRGECNTQRIVYYYPRITKNMVGLIDEVKKEDEKNEVIIMTEQNDLPQLKQYAQVTYPHSIRGMELRGQYTPLFTKIEVPIKTEICLYKSILYAIGGIESFIYYFCLNMAKYYDITVACKQGDSQQIARLKKIVKVSIDSPVICDTLIINSILDEFPAKITCKKSIQMVHCLKLHNNWIIPRDRDVIVNVSQVSQNSFKNEGEVIHNLTYNDKPKRSMILVTAARVGSSEKGARRMKQLAELLNNAKIPFIWLYFSDDVIDKVPANLIRMNSTLDVRGWIEKADYLVQLSDVEAYGYSIVEALELGVPVITTPVNVLDEIGFIDGVHGYVVPFNMDLSVADITDIYNSEFDFEYKNDTEKSIKKWRKIL